LETKLTEQGLDVSDQYHRTRSDQQALIDQTAESVLTDQAVGVVKTRFDNGHEKDR